MLEKEIIQIKQLKTVGYQDTKFQDKINYMFLPPKNKTKNNKQNQK